MMYVESTADGLLSLLLECRILHLWARLYGRNRHTLKPYSHQTRASETRSSWPRPTTRTSLFLNVRRCCRRACSGKYSHADSRMSALQQGTVLSQSASRDGTSQEDTGDAASSESKQQSFPSLFYFASSSTSTSTTLLQDPRKLAYAVRSAPGFFEGQREL